jgi:SAM-dependent methyltransferase
VSAPELFDRKLLRMRRERAALRGAVPDFLLRRVAEDMADRLAAVKRDFAPVVIIGAIPGLLGTALQGGGRDGPLVEMVGSPALLPQDGRTVLRLCGEEEALPFKDASLGLVVSGLTLHVANDLPGALVQIRRALKPDGLFLGAVLGGRTLAELRDAFIAAETEQEGGASPRVAPMADVRDYGGLMQRAGFALPVVDADPVTVTYASPLGLLRDLRDMGATNALLARRKTFLRRATLARALEIYQERHATGSGRVQASFEIIYLAGWAPHDSQQKPLKPGSATARLADALGVKEHRLKS